MRLRDSWSGKGNVSPRERAARVGFFGAEVVGGTDAWREGFFIMVLRRRVKGGGFEVWVCGLTGTGDGGEAPFCHFVLEYGVGYGGAFVKGAEGMVLEGDDYGEDGAYKEEETDESMLLRERLDVE